MSQASGPAEARTPGLIASLRQLGSTVVAILQSRAELLSHELHRERVRLTRMLVLAVVALFFLTLGMITATIFLIVLFWDSQRLVVIGFLTLLYLGIALASALIIKREAAAAKQPFAATVAQLKLDREHFIRR